MDKIIDAAGWACPKPVIETKKILDAMNEGTVTTIVDNINAVEHLTSLAAKAGCGIRNEQIGDLYHMTITKGEDLSPAVDAMASPGSQASATDPKMDAHQSRSADTGPAGKNVVIAITSDRFGTGPGELGETLMKSYIYALTEVSPMPRTLIFANSGAYFAIEGSAVLESLLALEGKGVEILTCGACLNYFGITDKLAVGSVSNMYVIAEKLNNAETAIRF